MQGRRAVRRERIVRGVVPIWLWVCRERRSVVVTHVIGRLESCASLFSSGLGIDGGCRCRASTGGMVRGRSVINDDDFLGQPVFIELLPVRLPPAARRTGRHGAAVDVILVSWNGARGCWGGLGGNRWKGMGLCGGSSGSGRVGGKGVVVC